MRVLAVSPHPDDDVIGAGGSLALHASAGHEVSTVHVLGRERSRSDAKRTDAELDHEIDAANAALGIGRRFQLRAPSRDLTVTRALRLDLVRVLRDVRPEVVYIPHADEVDLEHSQVHQVAMDALWMATSDFFQEAGDEPAPPPSMVLGYEVWTPIRRHAHVQDIGATIDLKERAMSYYESQLDQAAWVAAIRGMAAYRGTTNLGSGFAEVFTVESLSTRALAEHLQLG